MTNKKPTKEEIEQIKQEQIKVQKQKQKLTTTKKVLWLSWGLFIVLIIMTACGIETGIAMEIVGGLAATVTTSFYLWKSRCENREKIALGMVDELAEKYGIENVIQLLDAILRD